MFRIHPARLSIPGIGTDAFTFRFAKHLLCALLLGLCLPAGDAQGAECIPVGPDLRLRIPCAEYADITYQFDLAFFHHTDDPAGIYWKLDTASLAETASAGKDCLEFTDDLMLFVVCAEYEGVRYRFRLDAVDDSADPDGFYWKMDHDSFSEIPEPPPSGTGVIDIGEEALHTSAVYYAPASLAGKRNPGLLVYLPGDGESDLFSMKRRLERDFRAVADAEGLLVLGVQPNGRGFQIVDGNGKYQTDDYYNTVDAILAAHRTWAVNPYRTYVTGYSAGGPGAVMISRGQLKPRVRAVNIWCAPYNVYALIPGEDESQVPVRVVSNPGDGNYYSFFQYFRAGGNGSFGYWQDFLSRAGHPVTPVEESHISGHQYDTESVHNALKWLLEQ